MEGEKGEYIWAAIHRSVSKSIWDLGIHLKWMKHHGALILSALPSQWATHFAPG